MSGPALGNGRTTLQPGRQRRTENGRLSTAERVERAQSNRAQRFARRRQVRKITSLKRLRTCGFALDPENGVTVKVTENPDGTRTAGYGGLATCGSVWSCPQCAAKVATRRADELGTVMRKVDELGGSAFLLTLTLRHSAGDRLGLTKAERHETNRLKDALRRHKKGQQGWDYDDDQGTRDAAELERLRGRRGCWDVLGDAWAKVTSGATWKADEERFGGLLGWARVVEVTDGANGWHVHVHALLCFAEQVSADLVAAGVGARMFGRWQRELRRQGFDASEEHGWDLRKVQLGDGDLADYFTKIAHEVTGSHSKEGRRAGRRTPMQVLADAVDTYEVSNLARWWEWEAASEGRRQLTWSTGTRDLRKHAQLGHEDTDEEAAEDVELDGDVCIVVSPEHWHAIRDGGHEAKLLSLVENTASLASQARFQAAFAQLTSKHLEHDRRRA